MTELHFVARGEGPTCLVLSMIGTAPYERQLPAALDRRLQLVFVDVRGTGRSPGEATDLTFDRLAEDLEDVRRRLGVSQVAVLGHSALGILALEHARRCPDTVSHAVIVGTPPFGDMRRLMASGQAFFAEDASDERKRILAENLAALAPGTPPAQAMLAQTPLRFHDPRFDAAPLFAGAVVRPGAMEHILGTLLSPWTVSGDGLRAPLLVAHGRHDYTVPYTLWDEPLRHLPTATRVIFAESGHQPFVEEPARFTEVLAGAIEG